MTNFKYYFRVALLATLFIIIACMTIGCFKELDQIADDSSNPASNPNSGNGSENTLNSGLIAYYSFDDGTGNDGTSNHVDGILLNGVKTTDGIRGNGVFLNSFQNQYLNIPYNLFQGLTKFSVSFWIKDFGPGCIFAAQYTNSSNEYGDVPIFYASQNGKFTIKGDSGYEDYATQFSYNYQNQGIQSGDWHHLVVSLNNGVAKLYIDGNLVDQANISYSTYNNDLCSKVVFGGDKEGGYSISSSMKLDEINIFNRELTSNEVKKLYNLNY